MGKCSPLATLKNVMMPPFTSFLHQNVTFPFPYLLQSLYTNYSYLSTHIQQPILHTHPNTNSLLHYSRFYCTLTLLMWFTKVKNVKSLSFPIHFRIYVITFLPFRPKIADTEWFANTPIGCKKPTVSGVRTCRSVYLQSRKWSLG